MSGALGGPNSPVVDNSFVYPYGTTEQFPQMEDSDLNPLTNSAHYYMECSNKGTCSRDSGLCACFDGYEGVACQRASCPNSCSGHGVCKTIKQLATKTTQNVYKLWDRDATMGCDCDIGYFGPDCALKSCKVRIHYFSYKFNYQQQKIYFFFSNLKIIIKNRLVSILFIWMMRLPSSTPFLISRH